MSVKLKKDNSELFQNESDEGEVTIKPYEVDSLPNDYNISVLMDLIKRGYLKIPSFQRNYIWKIDMASKFIESIIIGLPIPQIFLFEQSRNNFLVIDGQQRIITIYLFKKKRFPKNDTARAAIRKYLSTGQEIPDPILYSKDFIDFNLKLPTNSNDKNPLNKTNYDTLPYSENFDFKASFDFNRTIRTITIKQLQPDDNHSSMFEIFSRLNSGGVTLRPQEIRMSLFYSDFFEKILILNTNHSWRKFLGKKDPDIHMNDVEVLVRAFAMLEMWTKYTSPMRIFLNKFSSDAKEFDADKIADLENLFLEFWSSCEELSSDVFKNDSGKFVISRFDAIFVAVCDDIRKNGLKNRHINNTSIQKLIEDAEFSEASQQRTAETSRVKKRIEKAKNIITLD